MPTEIQTGVGRIVWGNPAKAQIKKYQEGPQKGQPILKDGQPVNQWAWGVAFPKAEFQALIWPGMSAEAATGYPNGFPSNFAWKYVDGDSIDSNGQPYNKREGYAGCYILTVSTEAFAPSVFKWNGNQYIQLQPNEFKTGDFVAMKLSLKVNVPTDRTRKPSLYVNPIGILHVGYGQEIISVNADPNAIFGAQPQQYQLPPGASMTPLAPNTNVGMPGGGQPMMQPGGMPGGGQPMMQPGGMPMQPGQMPGGAPMVMHPSPGPASMPGTGQPQMMPGGAPMQYQPAHDFVQNAGQQPMMQPGQMQQPMQAPPAQGQMQMPGGAPMMPGMMPGNR